MTDPDTIREKVEAALEMLQDAADTVSALFDGAPPDEIADVIHAIDALRGYEED